jgi:hypothetical protein
MCTILNLFIKKKNSMAEIQNQNIILINNIKYLIILNILNYYLITFY